MYEYRLTPSLSVSFQRYPYPAAGVVTALPTSWGALPFLVSAPQRLMLPGPAGEAFWIGLVRSPAGRQHRLRVLVSTASGDRVDAVTGAPPDDTGATPVDDLPVPWQHGVLGIFRGDRSWWAFARVTGGPPAPACREIELRCWPVPATEPVQQTSDPRRLHNAGPGAGPRPQSGPPPESRPPQSPPPQSQAPQSPPPEADAAGNASSVRVDLVEPERFRALGGGRLPALDEADRYGGWRLP